MEIQHPGVTLSSTNWVSVWSGGSSLDDMRFSNTVTVEQSVLGPGVVGHILRNRSINKLTGATADRWFHYDQVGSVISESDASGLLAQVHHQDAFGNTQAAWNTGLWGGDKPGWHHNTKEYDGDTGLVYMYQRWYSAETGTFMSSAPLWIMFEHRYGFALSEPLRNYDPKGTDLYNVDSGIHQGIIVDDPDGNGCHRYDFALRYGPNITHWHYKNKTAKEAIEKDEESTCVPLGPGGDERMKDLLDREVARDPIYTGLFNCRSWSNGVERAAQFFSLLESMTGAACDGLTDWTMHD